MNKFAVNLLVPVLTVAVIYSCQLPERFNAEAKPNLLIVLTDDMGYGDVGISGNPAINTPNLDQLAAESIQFRNFYVSPVCAPTRASLLTGRYHQRTGVRSVTNGFETMDPDEVTLAEVLKTNGYRTGIFGKWHLGEYYPSVPNAQGFEEYLGFRTGHTNYYYDAEIESNGKPFKTSGHITKVLTDAALKFMGKNREEPFFCYLAYNAPHTPLQVDSSWWSPYAASGLAEREARIYGLIEQLDHEIGRMLGSLNEHGQLDNTLVIFMSDNGPINGWRVPQEQMRYNAGLRDQKFTTFDGGIRTQCYWKWGNHWQPRVEQAVAAHIDVMPTLMDLLDITLGQSHPPLDGINLAPVLEGKISPEAAERTFFQKYSLETLQEPAPFPGGIARKGSWKMVNGTELYHLEEDVSEQTNLADRYPDIFSELKAAYLRWYQDISDDKDLEAVTISVGHQQENPVSLQPHHGYASGQVKFWGNRGLTGSRRGTHPSGVDSDWTGGWQAAGDALEWKVSFARKGNYQFSVVARDTTNGALENLELLVNDRKVTRGPGVTGRTLTPDWQQIEMGNQKIQEGLNSLKIRLTGKSESALEIRSLVIYKTVD